MLFNFFSKFSRAVNILCKKLGSLSVFPTSVKCKLVSLSLAKDHAFSWCTFCFSLSIGAGTATSNHFKCLNSRFLLRFFRSWGEVSTWHTLCHLALWSCLTFSHLLSHLFLVLLCRFPCLILSLLLLLLVNFFICRVHLQICVQLSLWDGFAVAESNHIIKRQDQVKCLLEHDFLVNA